MEINKLIKDAHENALKHGFWDEINLLKHNAEFYKGSAITTYNFSIGNMLMLIVSEVAEAQDGLRHNDMDNFREELADVVEPEPMPEKYYLQLVPENDCGFINSRVHDGEIHIDDSEQTDYFQTQFTMEEIDSDPKLSRYKSFAVKVPAGELK